ncbi:hypothetical protein EOE67_09235 [Rheinheimera riviphila]|uniref:Uncharacterized protein n=1 Tax=Rheinheimera riviphila TaxID=1834037 RepID=A0A437QT31_9GAMM|nr:hypothetical protein [Rheinheimera riviphila]RVU37650.1 hypothetical protein EOE67_09235 [Rheinheimera riviphila]
MASAEISDIPGHPEKFVAGFTIGSLGEDHIKPRQKISGGIVTIARQFSQRHTALSAPWLDFIALFFTSNFSANIATKARLL